MLAPTRAEPGPGHCLPGLRPRIVVSRGAVADLSPEALAAVLVHERAHARGRHDVLIQPFVAWRQAFPSLPTARQALRSVELLAEMLAAGTGTTRAVADELARRDARPTGPLSPLPLPAAAAAYAVAGALILLPPALLALA